MKIARVLNLKYDLDQILSPEVYLEKAKSFFLKRKCKLRTTSEGKVFFKRGSVLFSLFGIGDPRHILQYIKIVDSSIQYEIHTWFNIFINADEKVIESEAVQFREYLSGCEVPSEEVLKKNLKRTYWQSIVGLIVFSITLALIFLLSAFGIFMLINYFHGR